MKNQINLIEVRYYLKIFEQPISKNIFVSDGSESRLGINLTLTRHFLADSYSILLEESRLGLDRARLFKTRTGSDSKGLTSDGSK